MSSRVHRRTVDEVRHLTRRIVPRVPTPGAAMTVEDVRDGVVGRGDEPVKGHRESGDHLPHDIDLRSYRFHPSTRPPRTELAFAGARPRVRERTKRGIPY